MARCLITGITGFVGSHLAEHYLTHSDYEIYGLIRNRSSLENIDGIKDKVKLIVGDLTDAHSIEKVIKEVKPDVIHHLAAQSFVPVSWSQPIETFHSNIIGSLNLFEAVKNFNGDCTVQIASTSEIYGGSYEIIDENTVPEPSSPYGVSKLAMDRLACHYAKAYDLKIVVTRAFNHTGPRRHANFVTSSFAKQIASLPQEGGVIKVGNLTAKRDWLDVRDVVNAYTLSIGRCRFGKPYNISREESYPVQYVLDKLIEISGKNVTVEQDPSRMRPSDIQNLLGISEKFRKETGWTHFIPFEKTLEDLYRYWEEKLGKA